MTPERTFTEAEICQQLGITPAELTDTITAINKASAAIGKRPPLMVADADGERLVKVDDGFAKALRSAGVDLRPRKPLGPMQPHGFEQDPDKGGSACRFCGQDEGNPVHVPGAGPL